MANEYIQPGKAISSERQYAGQGYPVEGGTGITGEHRVRELGKNEGMLSYSCSACGAELLAEMNTEVKRCPCCGSQTIAQVQLSGYIRPDYIIPFGYSKEEAVRKYHDFYRKRFLLPGVFKTSSHVDEIQGVYVPYWLFSGRAHLEGSYTACDESENNNGNGVKSGRYEVYRRGYLDYDNIPVDGSVRMEDSLMESIEPYRLDDLRDFSISCLSGFIAEKYDVSMEKCRERGHSRAENSIKSQVRASIRHEGIKEAKENVRFDGENTNFALFPVWLLVTKWNNRIFKFAMNGQTGKIAGDLPISVPKFVLIIIVLFAALMFVLIGIFGTDVPGAFLSAAVVDAIVGITMYSGMKPEAKVSDTSEFIMHPLTLTYQDETKTGAV